MALLDEGLFRKKKDEEDLFILKNFTRLGIIGLSISFLISLYQYYLYYFPWSFNHYGNINLPLFDFFNPYSSALWSANPIHLIISFIEITLGITGILLMRKLNKIGYFIYMFRDLLRWTLFFITITTQNHPQITFICGLISIAFIVVFTNHYKYFK